MTIATAAQVQQAYLAYFSRPADPSGLAYWMTQSVATMNAGFGASAEFNAFYKGMDTNQQVEQIYQNILGRQADVAGLNYWAAQIQSGVPISTLVNSILNTVLNNEGNTGVDYTTVTSRLGYSTQFTADIAANTSGASGYSGTAAASLARADLDKIQSNSTSAQILSIISGANMDTAAVIAASAPVSTPDVLTTASTTATAGAFFAALNGNTSTATLTGSDSLTGSATGTGNTLTITDAIPVNGVYEDLLPAGVLINNIQTMVVNGTVGLWTSGSVFTPFDVSGVAGLTSLTVNTSSTGINDVVYASSTTDVTVSSQGGGGQTSNAWVGGGHNITIDSNVINVTVGGFGAAYPAYSVNPSGTVTVNNTNSLNYLGSVTIDGGTAVVINENGPSNVYVENNTGNVTINDVGFLNGTMVAGGATISDIIVGSPLNPETGLININITTDAAVAESGFSSVSPAAAIVSTDGGTSVNIAMHYANSATEMLAISNGATAPLSYGSEIFVFGDGITQHVSVTQTAAGGAVFVDGIVTINDGTTSSTITDISLTNYNYASFTATVGGVLSTVNLSGGDGTLGISEASATAPAITFNLDGVSVAQYLTSNAITLTDTGNAITTLNMVTGANASTLTGLIDTSTALHTLNISGSSMLTIGGVLPTSLTALNLSGAAGFDGSIAGTNITNISVGGTVGVGSAAPTAPSLILAGSAVGDNILFTNEAGTQTISVASSAIAARSSAALTITALESAANATLHNVVYANFGGNTYAGEAAASNGFTVVELVGTHTFTGATGHVVLAS